MRKKVYPETVEEFLKQASVAIDAALERHLPPENRFPTELHKAVRYSVFAGGKRFRPALAMAAFEACGGEGEHIWYATTALEILHTFSLIHDDLPCMDDDDFRRGKPTNHKVFGEAIAVLAGDFLCAFAFELLAETRNPEVVGTLAKATNRMLSGQVADILSEGKSVGIEVVEEIHLNKTAALVEASVVMGAQLAGASDATVAAFKQYGTKIGLAFQIVDDVLDLEQTTEALGKDAGSDQERGKATYPSIIGIEASKSQARSLINEGKLELRKAGIDCEMLDKIADFIVTRVN